ncbi:MarR family winged helix-turn-helix transcriptional regulator [Pseudonocardia cypriaca]|uniref:DNA-binding MarR family transcriptional regulator n=1 Tax=Pseudonocardia cypriaca TaxID=882449 RepID=A0A543GA24_9PSEU|nr:MarR family transcriptional regulator [Pseudonocardia cypriaca]TQM42950.1 DNA-binding MarR family transcriptional regulator [Pseudonocardia cypriaca]
MDVRTAPARLRSMPSWLLNQVALPAQRIIAEALASVGARRQHYSVLSALEEFGPASQAALGRRCGIDRSDMVALVNELAAAGRLERTPDVEDRRRNVIAITDAGRKFLSELDRLLQDAQDDLLAPLSSQERAELVRLLGAVLAHHSG